MPKGADIRMEQMMLFQEKLELLQAEIKESILNEALNEVGNRYIAKVKRKTPVGKTGKLRESWSMNNSNRTRTSEGYVLTVTNPREYAEYVENGHRQEPGRFIPGLGEDGKGRRLVNYWVEGKFFAKESEAEMERIMPKLVQTIIEKRLLEVLKK